MEVTAYVLAWILNGCFNRIEVSYQFEAGIVVMDPSFSLNFDVAASFNS